MSMVRKSLGLYGLATVGLTLLIASCGGSGGGGGNGQPGSIVARVGTLYTEEGQILGGGPGEQVGLRITVPNEENEGAIWHNDLSDPVLLKPAGIDIVQLFDTDGTTQVGRMLADSSAPSPAPWHAVMFKGTTASMVDLHPAGYTFSQADEVEGDTQAGWAVEEGSGVSHPLLWHGSAGSIVNLLPTGGTSGRVRAITNGVQAGWVTMGGNGNTRAAMWQGTAASYVDLHPTGYGSSAIFGSSASDMVGVATVDPDAPEPVTHAFRWAGASRIDLHPSNGASYSIAEATDGQTEVGHYVAAGDSSGLGRACLWHGNAASFVDLHALLPAQFGHSHAVAVSGKIVSGWASDAAFTHWVPVIWELP